MNTTQTANKGNNMSHYRHQVQARQEMNVFGQDFVIVYTRAGEELYSVDKHGLEMFVRNATDEDMKIAELLAARK